MPPDILLKFGQIIGDQNHSDRHFLREEMGRAGYEGLHCGSSVDKTPHFPLVRMECGGKAASQTIISGSAPALALLLLFLLMARKTL